MQFLPSHKLDKKKWDECIDLSFNGLIYAKTFYLDFLHADWFGLIAEDYSWVVPIASRKKWTFSYLFQPAFLQQSGVFSKASVIVPYKEIISFLQNNYKFWEVNWNYATPLNQLPATIKFLPGANYVLDLSKDYQVIFSSYQDILKKNLKMSKRNNLTYLRSADYKNCIHLYQKQYGDRMPHVRQQDYNNFKNLCEYAQNNGELLCRQVANEGGELLSTILLLRDEKRLYNLMNTTPDAGRKVAANHFLIDSLINELAGTEMLLDFEGSDLPGVKAFYQQFGCENQPYFMLKYNALPWPGNLLKE